MRNAVLVTRPQPGAEATAARLRARNWQPIVAPLLQVQSLPGLLPAPGAVQAVLAASANAVAALPASHHALKLLAVGDATAARARQLGFTDIHSAAGDAAALAALAARLCRPEGLNLLVAAGEGQGERLALLLRAAGFSTIRKTVYAARPVAALPDAARQAIERQVLQAAMFFSAETARCFADLLASTDLSDMLTGTEALAIGAAAAQVLAPLPWARVRVAVKPTQDEMLALLT